MNDKIKIISIDFQKDFTMLGWLCFKPRQSVNFVKETLVPFLRKNDIKIAEIISDYRQPKPRSKKNICCPNEWGYESEIPKDIKIKDIWIKSMNSPIWVRENIGIADKSPWIPYQNTTAFNSWLEKNIGKAENLNEIVLIWLTVDCCVLSTAQELAWRWYKISILEEAVDTYTGDQQEKIQILNNYPLKNWAESISWVKLKEKLK